jgi:hypothetical protein
LEIKLAARAILPATQALRLSAQSLGAGSKGPPGILYRRLQATKGSKTAVKAVARKPGILFYTPVKNRSSYDPKIAAERTRKQTTMEVRRLHRISLKLGYEVKKIAGFCACYISVIASIQL